VAAATAKFATSDGLGDALGGTAPAPLLESANVAYLTSDAAPLGHRKPRPPPPPPPPPPRAAAAAAAAATAAAAAAPATAAIAAAADTRHG